MWKGSYQILFFRFLFCSVTCRRHLRKLVIFYFCSLLIRIKIFIYPIVSVCNRYKQAIHKMVPSNDVRIYKGNHTEEHEFPWMVKFYKPKFIAYSSLLVFLSYALNSCRLHLLHCESVEGLQLHASK